MQDLRGWAVINEKDELVGLDSSSGGYPYVPRTINGIHIWADREGAESYCTIMNNPNNSYGRFTPVEVELWIK